MKDNQTKRVLNIALSLFVLLAMTAFLFAQIAKFEAYAIDGEDEPIAVEEVQDEETVKPTIPLDEPEVLLDDFIEIITEEYAKELDTVSFEAKDGIVPSRLRGARLTSAEKKAYDLLKAKIEEVAIGENEEGLTSFEISFNDIYSEEFLELSYSAAELGVSAVCVQGDDGSYSITEAAQNAVLRKYPLDYSKIINALLYDCPYTLFWYDKTVGMTSGVSSYVSAKYIGGEFKAYCIPDQSYHVFHFAVSMDYCPESYYVHNFNGEIAPIQTDTDKIKSLTTAVDNAMSVVSAASGKGTYDKLDYYRDWICQKVTYDDAAADENSNTPYGDPWQLINAFDNNPNTNIVCEGYSKAFKYLCDLTENLDADCRIVTGNMGGGTGAGGHMWNVVEVGGKNYLVDVTNCDAGTIGAPRALFMVGKSETSAGSDTYNFVINGSSIFFSYDDETKDIYSREERLLATSNCPKCEHAWGEPQVTKEANCEEAGSKKKTCSKCNETVTETIPALGHDYQDVIDSAVAPTCTTAGKEVDKKCSRCNHVITGAEIAMLGHKWKNATCTSAKTCERCHEHDGNALGHDWNDATCTAAKTCKRCEATEGEALGHVWKDATCTSAKTCERCHETEGNALGHDYQDVIDSAVAPTCTTAGKEVDKKCSRCNHVITGAVIPMLDHDYHDVEGTAEDATCTTAGKEADKKCSSCNLEIEGAVIPMLGHDYQDVIDSAVAATCTTAGKEVDKKCSRCDHEIGGAVIPALGHKWKNATCTSAKTCERCHGHDGNALGHDWNAATCTAPKTCKRCNVKEGAALGHKWDAGKVTKAPNIKDEGEKTFTCTTCKTTKTESIAKLKSVKVPAGKTLTYNGKSQTGVAVVTGYTLSGTKAATNVGSYKATATLATGYGWSDGTLESKKVKWKINKASVSKATVTGIATKTYTGKAIAQSPKVVVGGRTLKNGTDYKLSYKNNLKVGKATVTITGYGNYNGSISKTFNIIPKGASLKSLSALKGGMTVYWNKQTAKMSTARITGYQIQTATDKNFKKNAKAYTVKGYNTASKKITGLKSKTTYYVRVRTYMKVGTVTYYSGWSAVKAIKAK